MIYLALLLLAAAPVQPGPPLAPAPWAEPNASPPGGPASAADLAVTAFTSLDDDGEVAVGAPVTFSATVRNTGTVPAPPTVAGFYLSADASVSADDVVLGEALVEALLPGDAVTVTLSTFIPSALVPNDYQALVRADDADAVAEPVETDNVAALPLRVIDREGVAFTGLYVETFDSMGAGAALPSGWRVGTEDVGDASTATEHLGGNGYGFDEEPGVVNFGSGNPETAGDRAVGFDRVSGSLFLRLVNETGAPVTAVEVGYIWEMYRGGFDEDVFAVATLAYSFDGEAWGNEPSFREGVSVECCTNGVSDAPAYEPGGRSINRVGLVELSRPVAPGDDLYLRFSYFGADDDPGDPSGPAGAPVMALDNVFVSLMPGVPLVFRNHAERAVPDTPVGGTGGGRGLIARFPDRDGAQRPTAVLAGAHPEDFVVEAFPEYDWPGLAAFLVRLQPTAPGVRTAELRFVVDGAQSAPVALHGFAEEPTDGFPTGPGPDFRTENARRRLLSSPQDPGRFAAEADITNVGAGIPEERTRIGMVLSDDAVLSDDDIPFGGRLSGSGLRWLPSGSTYTGGPWGLLPVDAAPGLHHVIVVADIDGAVEENIETNNADSFPIVLTDDGGPLDPLGGDSPYLSYRVSRIEVGQEDVRAGESVTLRVLVANVGGMDAPGTTLRLSFEGFYDGICYDSNDLLRIPIASIPAHTYRFETVTVQVPATATTGQRWVCGELDPEYAVEGQAWNTTAVAPLMVVAGVQAEPGPGEQTIGEVSPNPFRDKATLRFTLGQPEFVTVEVFDVLGRRMQVAYEGTPTGGEEIAVHLDAAPLPPGLYLVRLRGERFTATRQAIRVR